MSALVEDFADVFGMRGYAVRRDFVERDDVRALANECRQAWAAGEFAPGHVGRGAARERHADIRGDYVFWHGESGPSDVMRRTRERLEELRAAVNRRMYLGLLDLECHFAVYPPGAAYARHVDTFRDGGRRAVSWVLYLNEDWRETDGGALRVYFFPRSKSFPDHFDVPPLGGTLVAFLSERFEHEVLVAARERFSLTGWFRKRP